MTSDREYDRQKVVDKIAVVVGTYIYESELHELDSVCRWLTGAMHRAEYGGSLEAVLESVRNAVAISEHNENIVNLLADLSAGPGSCSFEVEFNLGVMLVTYLGNDIPSHIKDRVVELINRFELTEARRDDLLICGSIKETVDDILCVPGVVAAVPTLNRKEA